MQRLIFLDQTSITCVPIQSRQQSQNSESEAARCRPSGDRAGLGGSSYLSSIMAISLLDTLVADYLKKVSPKTARQFQV